MIKRLIVSLGVFAAVLGFSGLPFAAATSYAQDPLSSACSKLPAEEQKKNSACSHDPEKNPLFGPEGLLNKVALGIAVVAGFIAVIFMIIGGYKMILSNSDKQAFTNGRNTLIYAAVGLVIITIAQTLVSFIITRIGD